MDSKGSNHAYQNDSNEAEALWLYLTDNLQRCVLRSKWAGDSIGSGPLNSGVMWAAFLVSP